MNTRFSIGTASLCVLMGGMNFVATPAYAWTDDNPPGASQCADAGINDAGSIIENCLVSNTPKAYLTVAGARSSVQLAPLPSTPGGVPCSADGISNAAAGSEIVIGACADANNVSQAVAWQASSPGTAIQLQPIGGLLGLGADVSAAASAVNQNGYIIGESVNVNGVATPVVWMPGSNTPTPLPVLPLLATNQNCVPASINDAQSPSIIGNCPGASGKNQAVLWPSAITLIPTLLPVPPGASYCSASGINTGGKIFGQCVYGTATYRVVQWGAGGTGPTVLMTVDSLPALRTTGADQNDSGIIAVNYLAGGAQAGFKMPARWDPSTGTNAPSIALPSNGNHGSVGAIGDNGRMFGNYETTDGYTHPFHVEAASLTATDEGSPEGGRNAALTAISKNGRQEAGAGEDGTEHTRGMHQSLP